MTKSMAWDLWAAKLIMGFCSVNTVFCPLLIHAAKQMLKSEKKKMNKNKKGANFRFQSQKMVTNKQNVIK